MSAESKVAAPVGGVLATYEVWPAANGDDDPAEFRIDRIDSPHESTIIAWVYSEADARLLAAAPELLAALESLLSAASLSAARGIPFAVDSPGIVAARAAIARATGAAS